PAYPPGLGQISAADPPRKITNKSKSGSLRSQSRGRQPIAVVFAFAFAFFLDLPVVRAGGRKLSKAGWGGRAGA
ncbi:hypothetical protein JY441_12360, partial [Stenotrophomonas maltophilia]|nr:hypothetical protein [Stenotrophomonas maltophilia]